MRLGAAESSKQGIEDVVSCVFLELSLAAVGRTALGLDGGEAAAGACGHGEPWLPPGLLHPLPQCLPSPSPPIPLPVLEHPCPAPSQVQLPPHRPPWPLFHSSAPGSHTRTRSPTWDQDLLTLANVC